MWVEIYRDATALRVHDAGRDVSRVRARSVEESVDECPDMGRVPLKPKARSDPPMADESGYTPGRIAAAL
jgi:hypothetical protein